MYIYIYVMPAWPAPAALAAPPLLLAEPSSRRTGRILNTICIYNTNTYIYIYTYIQRERERDIDTTMYNIVIVHKLLTHISLYGINI